MSSRRGLAVALVWTMTGCGSGDDGAPDANETGDASSIGGTTNAAGGDGSGATSSSSGGGGAGAPSAGGGAPSGSGGAISGGAPNTGGNTSGGAGSGGTGDASTGGASAGGAGSGGATGIDDWNSFASAFFASYCVSCHNADQQGDMARDYSTQAGILREPAKILCGVATPEAYASHGCTGFPPAEQFPIGDGPKPTAEERLRLVAWIDAGMP